jgi:AcrR family transcriptional regulator
MRFTNEAGGRRARYHHGNLREALVATALDLIAEHGPAGFAFAEVARAAGVSPAAPYRHFRDLNALLAEVAQRGFALFATALAAGRAEGGGDPVRALERCGRAYLGFARQEPAYYAAMFETGLLLETEPSVRAASDRAFSVLREAAEAACAVAPPGRRPPALMVALHLWAMAHGIASLFIGGGRRLPMSPEELLEAGGLIYLQSLGLAEGAGKSGGGA